MSRRSSRKRKSPYNFNEENFNKIEEEKKKNQKGKEIYLRSKKRVPRFKSSKIIYEEEEKSPKNLKLHNEFQYKLEKSGKFIYCYTCSSNIVDKHGQECFIGDCPCGCAIGDANWEPNLYSQTTRRGGDEQCCLCPVCQIEELTCEFEWFCDHYI